MAVLVRCGACGAEFRADSKHRGKETQCGKCHQPIVIDGAAIADYDVFISYSNVDKPAADAVCASLEAKKWRCWIAPRDVLPGSEWGAAIVNAIEQSRLMVLVYSSHANNSQQVIREVERAVNKAVPIIPFRIEAVPPSKNMEYFLSASHWMDAMTKPMAEHLEELGRVIKALLKANSITGLAPKEHQDERTDAVLARPKAEQRGSMKWLGIAMTIVLLTIAGLAVQWTRRTNRRVQMPQLAIAPSPVNESATSQPAINSGAKLPTTSAAATQPAPISQRTVLVRKQPFLLRRVRPELRFPITVPPLASGVGMLQISMDNMGDNSGDGGMFFILQDGNGHELYRKFSTVSPTYRYPVTSGSKWTVVLLDQDATQDGNGGSIEVAVVPK